jgi:hypothetical protein
MRSTDHTHPRESAKGSFSLQRISQTHLIPKVGEWFEVKEPYRLSSGENEQVSMISIIKGKLGILFFCVHLIPYNPITGERIPIEDFSPQVCQAYTILFPAEILPEKQGTLKDFAFRMKRI